MQYKGLTLDKFQKDAIAAIEKNNSVVVSAPTGSGKTLIADYIIDKHLGDGSIIIYTAPIKALSNQKYKDFCKDYGRDNIGLITGDIVINPTAPVLVMTTEIYRNMTISNDPSIDLVKYVVFDEIHYINDIERGYVWEESLIFSKKHVRFLCLSATIPNVKEFSSWISAIKKHKVVVVKYTKRPVPLENKFYDAELGITTLEEIKKRTEILQQRKRLWGAKNKRELTPLPRHTELIREIKEKVPCFFFTFSRQRCQDNAMELANAKIFDIDPQIGHFIREKLSKAPKEINDLKSTRQLRKTLPYGVAFHHAGLIPIIKELVEDLFSRGLIKVLYTTETFAVGINMPAKTVCFNSLMKYDGITFRQLNSKEYFQIAGRAGRRGIDKKGFVYAMIDRRDFSYDKLTKLTTKDVDPIISQFRLSYNTVLNLIDQHNQKEIEKIICMNFGTYQIYGNNFETAKKAEIYRTFNNIKKILVQMEYIKNDKLTKKGKFASKIYSDELITSEIFATKFASTLDDFQIIITIAALSFELRPKTEFYNIHPTKASKQLYKNIKNLQYVQQDARFKNIKKLTAVIQPIFEGQDIFDVMKNTNLLEGDIIRLFRQILDRIGQIKNAAKDEILLDKIKTCERRIIHIMDSIDGI